MTDVECEFCDHEPVCVILSTTSWIVHTHPELGVPGWYVLRTRRHIENLAALSSDEAAELGGTLSRLAVALADVIDVTKVYVLGLSERISHLHFLIATRPTALEPMRGLELLSNAAMLRDDAAAAALAEQLRDSILARSA
jgi:diadenosine tetraphosphate (Ap4A) HIT family hydrolase